MTLKIPSSIVGWGDIIFWKTPHGNRAHIVKPIEYRLNGYNQAKK